MKFCILLIISFIVSVASIYFLRKLAIKYHIYDEPGVEKIHQKPTPYFGGLGMFLGFIVVLIMASGLWHLLSWLQAIGIVLGSVIILSLGLFDDFKWKKRGRPFLKLIYQFLAGFLIVFILIKIGVNFHFSINPVVMALIAALYVVGIMNAINVSDGMDGLAGGVVGISLIGFIILAFISGNSVALILSGTLLASILGFLIYNWQPASIFMGDSGSHFLGFILAALAISFTGHPLYNFRQFIGPLLIVGFPIVDIGWAIIRRLIKGGSPFARDRNYLYDQMHFKLKLSIPKTVLVVYLCQIILVASGILIYYL